MTTPSMSATQMGRALRAQDTTSVRLRDGAVRRIRARNPELGAFVLLDDLASSDAAVIADREFADGIDRGPLHGIPVAVKDLFDMAGLPTTCGSASSFGTARADIDAEVISDLRRSGAVIVGKTVLHEFAFGATGDRSAHGPSRNPHDHLRVSGGSSGGSAVAVASGMVPLSLGTDTAGSVRVPAALCGVIGFKPAFGVISVRGVHPLAPSLDHVGLFGASLADTKLFYEVLSGTTVKDIAPVDRIGWVDPEAITRTDPEITAAVRGVLHSAGVGLAEATATVRGYVPGELFSIFSALQAREAYEVHRDHLDADEHLIDPGVVARLRVGATVD